jgi:hypothetical protein
VVDRDNRGVEKQRDEGNEKGEDRKNAFPPRAIQSTTI